MSDFLNRLDAFDVAGLLAQARNAIHNLRESGRGPKADWREDRWAEACPVPVDFTPCQVTQASRRAFAEENGWRRASLSRLEAEIETGGASQYERWRFTGLAYARVAGRYWRLQRQRQELQTRLSQGFPNIARDREILNTAAEYFAKVSKTEGSVARRLNAINRLEQLASVDLAPRGRDQTHTPGPRGSAGARLAERAFAERRAQILADIGLSAGAPGASLRSMSESLRRGRTYE